MLIQDFEHCSEMPVNSRELFAWHEKPQAFGRLRPPWEKIQIINQSGGITKGGTAEIQIKIGPFWVTWKAEHTEFEQGKLFIDRQTKGPFAFWEHRHEFSPLTDQTSAMKDHIRFAAPMGFLGNLLLSKSLKARLRETFIYRHQILRTDLQAAKKAKGSSIRTIMVTGASGFIGSSLCPFLEMAGFRIIPVSRNQVKTGKNFVKWNPQSEAFPAQALDGVDAIIHLAGESIATGYWTQEKKNRILNSRVQSTHKIATALANTSNSIQVFLCASAIGAYGSRPGEILTETSPSGVGFLADVCKHWEDATAPAIQAGKRVISMRSGVILSLLGGALPELLFPFRLRLGSFLGSSNVQLSWIALDDLLHAILHMLLNKNIHGPVNLTAPNPVSNAEFIQSLERVFNRKSWFSIPTFPIKLLMGQKANELLFSDLKALPNALLKNEYEFLYPCLEQALRHLLGKHPTT